WPAQAPVNLTTELHIKQAGVRSAGSGTPEEQKFTAVELTITANNPSTRIVLPLQNYWVVRGYKVTTHSQSGQWLIKANANVGNGGMKSPGGAYFEMGNADLVAGGRIMADVALKPQETVSRTFTFYLPSGVYDMLEVEAALPSTAKKDCMELSPKE